MILLQMGLPVESVMPAGYGYLVLPRQA